MNNFNHFKNHVDIALREKLLNIINNIDVMKFSLASEYYEECDIQKIEGNHVSGWIARQDGGYYKEVLHLNSYDPSHAMTEQHINYLDNLQGELSDDFKEYNNLKDDDEIPSDLLEFYWDHMDSGLGNHSIQAMLYVRGSEVLFDVVAEYGPTKELVYSKTYPIPHFIKNVTLATIMNDYSNRICTKHF